MRAEAVDATRPARRRQVQGLQAAGPGQHQAGVGRGHHRRSGQGPFGGNGLEAGALVAAELQTALQEDVGQVVLSLGIIGLAVVLQRVVLFATRQVGYVGDHQVISVIQ